MNKDVKGGGLDHQLPPIHYSFEPSEFYRFTFSRLFLASVFRSMCSEDTFLCSMHRKGPLLNYKGSSFPQPEGRPSFTAGGSSAITAFV